MSSHQDEFDDLVNTFNQQYLALLKRAAAGDYDRLVEAFLNIKDFYDMILTMHDVEDLAFRVPLFPLTLRGNREYLQQLGFTDQHVAQIHAFFLLFRAQVGKDLEEVGSE